MLISRQDLSAWLAHPDVASEEPEALIDDPRKQLPSSETHPGGQPLPG
jgi:hypothetical protein